MPLSDAMRVVVTSPLAGLTSGSVRQPADLGPSSRMARMQERAFLRRFRLSMESAAAGSRPSWNSVYRSSNTGRHERPGRDNRMNRIKAYGSAAGLDRERHGILCSRFGCGPGRALSREKRWRIPTPILHNWWLPGSVSFERSFSHPSSEPGFTRWVGR